MRKLKNERGAALLTVLVAMMIITIILFEFQYAAMVERKLAYNDLNQTQAYYLAKSGARVGILRVALYTRLRSQNLPEQVKPYLEKIWSLPLPAFPPQGGTVNKMAKADKDAAEKVLEQTKITEGTYTHVITTEASKINLNLLQPPSVTGQQPAGAAATESERINFTEPKSSRDHIAILVKNILDGFLRDSERPYEEYPDLRPEELVMDIADWVSPGNNRLAGGAKDSFYEQQKPPYKAKKNRFYTVEELKMVRGIDDHIYNKLKPNVTVYSSDGKINLNSANKTVYRALYPDFTEDDLKKIIEERDKREGWMNPKDFVEYVKTTLGRTGISTLYPNENDYPFTTTSESFLVEAMGRIEKSKSSVSRTIRVAVSLGDGAGQRGGQVIPGADEASCNANPNYYWRRLAATCIVRPRNQQECQAFDGGSVGGQWTDRGGRFGCAYPNDGIAYPPGGAAAGQGGAKAKAPQNLKILYWSES